jgi:hypothetical protein
MEDTMLNKTIKTNQSMQITLPLYQPLRFWTPKPAVQRSLRTSQSSVPALQSKGFTMKGGFVQSNDGVRRMIIAGKIVKNESAVRL